MSLRSGLRPTQTAWIAGWAFSPAYPKGRLSLEMVLCGVTQRKSLALTATSTPDFSK